MNMDFAELVLALVVSTIIGFILEDMFKRNE